MKIQEQLRQDLLAIFGFNNVKFGKYSYGAELNVLWVDILNIQKSYSKNQKDIQIELELSYSTPLNQSDCCYLDDKLEVSNYQHKNRITLEDSEDTINYTHGQDEFKRVIKYATYIISDEFNTERTKLAGAEFNYIINDEHEEKRENGEN